MALRNVADAKHAHSRSAVAASLGLAAKTKPPVMGIVERGVRAATTWGPFIERSASSQTHSRDDRAK
jgi:hypothetical protein